MFAVKRECRNVVHFPTCLKLFSVRENLKSISEVHTPHVEEPLTEFELQFIVLEVEKNNPQPVLQSIFCSAGKFIMQSLVEDSACTMAVDLNVINISAVAFSEPEVVPNPVVPISAGNNELCATDDDR